jgi:hypothetical protein
MRVNSRTDFVKRNKGVISLRKSQAPRLGRAIAFNRRIGTPLLLLFIYVQNTVRLYHVKPTKDGQVLLLLDSTSHYFCRIPQINPVLRLDMLLRPCRIVLCLGAMTTVQEYSVVF